MRHGKSSTESYCVPPMRLHGVPPTTLHCSRNRFRSAVNLRLVSCRLTAIPNAFFVPTKTTNFFPLVTALGRSARLTHRVSDASA